MDMLVLLQIVLKECMVDMRNLEGEMLLEFACAMDLVVANTWLQKEVNKKVTYESGGCRTVVDYVLVRRCEKAIMKDVKVISGEPCIPQHKLMVCVIELKEHLKRKKVFGSRCKVWKLKDIRIQSAFHEKVQLRADARNENDDVECVWKGLRDSLLAEADVVCGRTKEHSRYREMWWWNMDVFQAVED